MDAIGANQPSTPDLSGTIHVEFEGLPGNDFSNYIKSLGSIDLNRYRPFGLELVAVEAYDGLLKETEVRVLAYDLINNQAIVRFNRCDTFENFMRHVWNLSIVITDEGYTDKTNLVLKNEINPDDERPNRRAVR